MRPLPGAYHAGVEVRGQPRATARVFLIVTAMPATPSRESFFALYWDHARDVSRFNLCVLAGFPSADIPELQRQEWATLMIWERDKLRAALLRMVTIHAEVVAEAERSRALRGEKVPA